MNDINRTTDSIFASLGLTRPDPQQQPGSDKLGQEDFLELLTTQLQNQDPLKPMENGEFLSQIAQFSTVSGIQDLQSSFGQLATALYSNQALQASVMVGRDVLVPSGLAQLYSGSGLAGAVELPASTTALTVEITDANGQVVKQLPLGGQAAGLVQFKWDGTTDAGTPAVPGSYGVRATALLDDDPVAVDTLVGARVESVTLGKGGQGLTLNLTGMGPVDFSQIKQIM